MYKFNIIKPATIFACICVSSDKQSNTNADVSPFCGSASIVKVNDAFYLSYGDTIQRIPFNNGWTFFENLHLLYLRKTSHRRVTRKPTSDYCAGDLKDFKTFYYAMIHKAESQKNNDADAKKNILDIFLECTMEQLRPNVKPDNFYKTKSMFEQFFRSARSDGIIVSKELLECHIKKRNYFAHELWMAHTRDEKLDKKYIVKLLHMQTETQPCGYWALLRLLDGDINAIDYHTGKRTVDAFAINICNGGLTVDACNFFNYLVGEGLSYKNNKLDAFYREMSSDPKLFFNRLPLFSNRRAYIIRRVVVNPTFLFACIMLACSKIMSPIKKIYNNYFRFPNCHFKIECNIGKAH